MNQSCCHLGNSHARSQRHDGTPFEVFHCSQFGHCTQEDHGLKLSGGKQAMAVCSCCPLYSLTGAGPLVSAICLAYDLPRRQTVLEEAVESFLRQDWPDKELIIVVDTPDLVIACDAPGVRILSVPPCATLGDKYNAGVAAARGSLICSWDDDDISLPWRMSLSVELLGDADYFNPKAYWCLYGGKWKHEVKTGYAHNASLFRKSAWERVGGYKPMADNSQDAVMDRELLAQCRTVIGDGAIERTAYLYRFSTGLHHGSTGNNPDAAGGGTFQLNPHWEQDYTRLTIGMRPAGIPCWLTNRDTMDVKRFVEQLLLCDGVGEITIVDCDSTYQPLLDWYDQECPVKVIKAPNLGHLAPWKYLDQSTMYLVSDADFDLTGVPRDVLLKLGAALDRFPNIIKAGLSLRVDDLPADSPVRQFTLEHEAEYWQKPIDEEHYDAAVDTTPAMYRAGSSWGGYAPAVRLAPPYSARHTSWYVTQQNLTDDWRHYFSRLDPHGIVWGPRLAKALTPIAGPKLTIGMPTYRDFNGVAMTLMSLLVNHAECRSEIEIIVIDNDAQGDTNSGDARSHSGCCKRFCSQNGAKYEHYTAVQGTAAAKARVFELATAPAVLVIDCHVLLPSGVLRRLIDWFTANPQSKDLLQGVLIADGGLGSIAGTHFAPRWGSWMFGQWAIDREKLAAGKPFEIEAQGCGLFACTKAAWPGFHPLLKGFGPEEFHLHNRIRRNGGRCLCAPWLTWWHRFANPDRQHVGMDVDLRLRGYFVTFLDTGYPDLESIRGHYVTEKGVSQERFDRLLVTTRAEFMNTPIPPVAKPKKQMPNRAFAPCSHLGVKLRDEACTPCKGNQVEVRACRIHGECVPRRFRNYKQPQVCNRSCPQFTELVQIEGPKPIPLTAH